MSFTERFQYLITLHSLTHKEIEEKTGVKNISKYKSGIVKPSYDAIISLSDFFGVTTDWLLKGIGPGPTDPDEQLINDLIASETLEGIGKNLDNADHIPDKVVTVTLRNYFFSHSAPELKEWVELFESAPAEARPVLLNAAHAIAHSYPSNPNKALSTSQNTVEDEQAAAKSDIA